MRIGTLALFRLLDHLRNPLPAADVPRIEPEPVDPLFQGQKGQAVVEMDIGNQWNGNGFFDRA